MEIEEKLKELGIENLDATAEEVGEMEDFKKDLDEMLTEFREKGKSTPEKQYSVKTLWKKMEHVCKALSKECTKTATAYANPETLSTEKCKAQMKNVIKCVHTLESLFEKFPIKEGKTLHDSLKVTIGCIIHSTLTFLENLDIRKTMPRHSLHRPFEARITNDLDDEDYKRLIGTVWENCDRFQVVARDNRTAAEGNISSSASLVDDALSEVKMAIEEHDDKKLTENSNDVTDNIEEKDESEELNQEDDKESEWSDSDRQLLKPCVAILTASRGLLTKCCTAMGTLKRVPDRNNDDIDNLTEALDKISGSVDNLVLTMYPPIVYNDLRDKIIDLKNIIEAALTCCRLSGTFGTKNNLSWIEFIQKALHHNLRKFNDQMPECTEPITTTAVTESAFEDHYTVPL